MFHVSQNPDPFWSVAIGTRRAALWIGGAIVEELPTGTNLGQFLGDLLSVRWQAVFVDTRSIPLSEAVEDVRQGLEPWRPRVVTEDPATIQLAANTIPIFCLQGDPAANPLPPALATLRRLSMLSRMPQGSPLFAVGVSTSVAQAPLRESYEISKQPEQVVIPSSQVEPIRQLDWPNINVSIWTTPLPSFAAFVRQIAQVSEGARTLTVRVRSGTGFNKADLSSSVDASYPITDRFDLLPESEVATAPVGDAPLLEKLLENPTAAWTPYAAAIPYPRHLPYEQTLRSIIKQFRGSGAASSQTAWIRADDGSGATTVLRQITFNLAREGYPVLIARPNVQEFDFKQISAFLTSAGRTLAALSDDATDTPWIVAFDAQHTQLNWDFVTGLANGLKKLLRPVLVVAVAPTGSRVSDGKVRAAGVNRELGPVLESSVSLTEGRAVGAHLEKFLPPQARRSDSDWTTFVSDVRRAGTSSARSLFWVALRFWLFRFQASTEPFRNWFASAVSQVVKDDSELMEGLLETAAFSAKRLAMPAILLRSAASTKLSSLAKDESNLLGLRAISPNAAKSFAFAHTLIADELLRLAKESAVWLKAVGQQECLNQLDLELHLFERILRRPEVGHLSCVPVVEDLVTAGLRVDPFDAPRNYQERHRIVCLLELAPDSLFDASQIFNHHLAKARRHLALDPPAGDPYWTEDTRREQLELAEQHLKDALNNIKVSDPSRQESPLNLYVSLALTHAARSFLEKKWGRAGVADDYDRLAAEAYHQAGLLDPENTYFLENYGRFLIRAASGLPQSQLRLKHLTEAILFLQRERDLDQSVNRETTVTIELAKAYELLAKGSGDAWLLDQIGTGSEAACVAMAQLTLRRAEDATNGLATDARATALSDAERVLLKVSASSVTWRSRSLLYRVVSLRHPNDFNRRLDLLRELETTDFLWPVQLKLERGILLYQLGSHDKGVQAFTEIRDHLRDRSGPLRVPHEMRYLMDPASGFSKPLRTAIVVQQAPGADRNMWGIPLGWGHVRVPFRQYIFNRDSLTVGTEIGCLILFTNFGPQAVPETEYEQASGAAHE
jgi:hypothetical protein